MAEPRVSNKRLRDAQRVVHLIGGLMLSVCVYPVGGWFYSDLRRGAQAVRGFPTIVATGMLMWRLPRLRKRLRDRARERGTG